MVRGQPVVEVYQRSAPARCGPGMLVVAEDELAELAEGVARALPALPCAAAAHMLALYVQRKLPVQICSRAAADHGCRQAQLLRGGAWCLRVCRWVALGV